MRIRKSDGEVASFLGAIAALGRHEHGRVLAELVSGASRFNELAGRLPGLEETALGTILRELDAAALIVRRVDPGPPLRVLYALTAAGADVAPALAALRAWHDSR